MTTKTPPLVLSPTPFPAPTGIRLPDGVPVVEIQHRDVTLADLYSLFDGGFPVLGGLGPVGPGYAIYDGDTSGSFDLTIGFPVAPPPAMSLTPTNAATAPTDLPDGVTAGTFPSGAALVASHLGGFDGLPAAWQELTADPRLAGRTRVIEIYVTDPSQTTEAELRTDLVVPLG